MKGDVAATLLLRSSEYRKTFSTVLNRVYQQSDVRPQKSLVALAHSRLVTNGRAERPENNQPVQHGQANVVHNGIIVNVDELWESNQHLQRRAEVDTEVIAALLDEAMTITGDMVAAMQAVFGKLQGAASIAWTCAAMPAVGLATNTGDLFLARSRDNVVAVFGSERFILSTALAGAGSSDAWGPVVQLPPGKGLSVSFDPADRCSGSFFNLADGPVQKGLAPGCARPEVVIEDLEISRQAAPLSVIMREADLSLLRYSETTVAELRRCARCVLPETFPFIQFDSQGVCNYCHG